MKPWTNITIGEHDVWVLTDNGVIIVQSWIRDGKVMTIRTTNSPTDKSPAPLVRLESDRNFEGL